VSETSGKTDAGVKTGGAAAQPISEKNAETVRTQGLVAPASEVKPILAEGAAKPAEAVVPVAPAEPVVAQDASTLPPPDAVPTAADLKNPAHLLSRRLVLFDYDSAAIREEYRPVLEAHVSFLKTNQDAKVILQGHADERGSREYNLALGQRRAESVYKVMSLLGVGEAQMEAVSLGEEKPLVEGHDETAWQQNRRTELLYQGE
jgi:peptidoglycan-associated lipoprotein